MRRPLRTKPSALRPAALMSGGFRSVRLPPPKPHRVPWVDVVRSVLVAVQRGRA